VWPRAQAQVQVWGRARAQAWGRARATDSASSTSGAASATWPCGPRRRARPTRWASTSTPRSSPARPRGRRASGRSARYVTGTFADLGTGDLADFDVVYARCVLSHLPDPAPAVTAMLRAARPGGLVLVEDVEVAAVWSSPVEPALVRHVEFYVAAARAIGARPDVGPELAGALRAAGAEAVDVDVVQPVLRDPADLRIHARTMEAIADPVLAHGLATADEIDAVVARLDAWADEPGVVATLPRFVQVAGRPPGLIPPDPAPLHADPAHPA